MNGIAMAKAEKQSSEETLKTIEEMKELLLEAFRAQKKYADSRNYSSDALKARIEAMPTIQQYSDLVRTELMIKGAISTDSPVKPSF